MLVDEGGQCLEDCQTDDTSLEQTSSPDKLLVSPLDNQMMMMIKLPQLPKLQKSSKKPLILNLANNSKFNAISNAKVPNLQKQSPKVVLPAKTATSLHKMQSFYDGKTKKELIDDQKLCSPNSVQLPPAYTTGEEVQNDFVSSASSSHLAMTTSMESDSFSSSLNLTATLPTKLNT